MVYEQYIKDNPIFTKNKVNPNSDLIKSIIQTREDLQNANRNYEFAEEELIDYYLYQIKAVQSKYNYLLRKAKQSKLLVTMVDEIEIKNFDEVI